MDSALQIIQQEIYTTERNYDNNKNDNPQLAFSNLERIGGFRFLKSIIRGIEIMDPHKRASKQAFLTDPFHKEERETLGIVIDQWIAILENDNESIEEAILYLQELYHRLERSLIDNLASVREEIKNLEVTYRGVESFFENLGKEKTDNVCMMNVDKSRLLDYNSEDTKAVVEELNNKYDQLDLKNSHSIILIPGYLGDADNIRFWAKKARKNKALLVTDFEDSYSYNELIQRFKKSNIGDNDISLSCVVMACNYILARRRSEISDEDDDLYIPASTAIAGRMCDTENIHISQGVAGKRHGMINEALSVRFDMLKSELTLLIDLGIVPLIETDGRIYAFSNRTLYNGPIDALKEYTIVRVFDWVSKVIQQFCNDEALVIWDSKTKSELTENILCFLTKYKGSEQLYENFTLKEITQDPITKNVLVSVEIKPFYATKNFLIELTGTKQQSNIMNWEQSISQK